MTTSLEQRNQATWAAVHGLPQVIDGIPVRRGEVYGRYLCQAIEPQMCEDRDECACWIGSSTPARQGFSRFPLKEKIVSQHFMKSFHSKASEWDPWHYANLGLDKK